MDDDPPFVCKVRLMHLRARRGLGNLPKKEGAPSSCEPIRLTVRRSSPAGVASLIGAVGGPVMERLSLSEGPGNEGGGLHKYCCQKICFSMKKCLVIA
jgi:hypothetical protein